jgi:tRNA G18 (ribose-2'-O)-methylase SpoU
MKLIFVANLDDPALAPYRTLRRPVEHWRRGIFVAEGRLVVERLLRSGLRVLSVLVVEEWAPRAAELLRGRPADLPVFVARRRLVEKLVGFAYHQGYLAVAECPRDPTLAEWLGRTGPPRTLVALDGVTSAENVGCIVRNCAGLAAHGVLVGETACSPYLRRAVRNSLGGVFSLPILHLQDLAATLQELRDKHAFRIVAAEAQPRTPIAQLRFPPDVCVVLGHEDRGLSERVRLACQDFVTIPMSLGVEALNVAAASAVFLYEIWRQKTLTTGFRV